MVRFAITNVAAMFMLFVFISCVATGEPLPPAAVTPLTQPTRVTLRDDLAFLVNDKPFFPIGLYYVNEELADPAGRGLRELREMRFNYVFYAGEPRLDQLDRVAKNGLYIHYRPPGSLYANHDTLDKTVAAVVKHPAMLWWEMEDEPVLNKVDFEKSREGYALMKKLDPDHPILVNHWPNPKYITFDDINKWSAICDINGFDFYPVPLKHWEIKPEFNPDNWKHSIGIMGRFTDRWYKAAPTKPVVVVLQAWSWDPLKYGKDGYPTNDQSRFMAYQSIIRGAKGISYYGIRTVSAPHTAACVPAEIDPDPVKAKADFAKAKELNTWFWSYFPPVVRELSAMSPVFVARDANWKAEVKIVGDSKTKPEEIELRVKQVGDNAVMLVVNDSDTPATVEFTAPPFKDATVHAWLDKREIKADPAGRFRDRLEPYSTRVYSNKAMRDALPSP